MVCLGYVEDVLRMCPRVCRGKKRKSMLGYSVQNAQIAYHHPGSNWRPSACEADVITNYTMAAALISTVGRRVYTPRLNTAPCGHFGKQEQGGKRLHNAT